VGRAIISAPLDLQSLAEVVYQQAGQIVDTSIFQLGLFEGNRYRLLIWVLDGERQPLQEFRLMPDSLGIVGWLRESKRSLLVRDFESEQDSLPAKPRYIAERPPRSAAFVPLMVADSVLGAIAIQSRRPNAFDDEHVRLLTIVANHAAAALEKARVYEQAQERAAHLTLIAEVTQQINVLQPLPALYKQIVDGLKREVSEGRLAPGTALPSFRRLAEDLLVSIITVKRAYEELERDGIILRKVYPQVPPKVEYSLTKYGQSLRPFIELTCELGKAHIRHAHREKTAFPQMAMQE